ncbi:ornithine cyclodeaminase family protein [Henriciella aquimarina]|uniref:ornithine cyclodeaminase family protein n=1 Tax=Henriciella aquimarina TaxID=545261 RepID=UPI0009FCCEE6|nr:ornithine cyclodeaminase family protein [Henriciella aquimarina]
MHFVSEPFITSAVSQDAVTEAIRQVYAAMAGGDATNFPVVRERLGYADAIFGFKSGFDRTTGGLGVKAGGLWPGNAAKGLANHQSTILLFDPDTGAPEALVEAGYLTALRTASASALSTRLLARDDVKTLSIIGAGGQALHQIRAVWAERSFERVLVSARSLAGPQRVAAQLNKEGIEAVATDMETAAREADVLITITPSFEAFVRAAWIREGTHIACMGADTKGKHEVEPGLIAMTETFVDEPAQAISIGECQHAYELGLIEEAALTPIGAVISGQAPGRSSPEAITLFDSTGVGLQDIAAARLALRTAQAAGAALDLRALAKQ